MKTYQTTVDIAKCISRWYTHVKYYQAKSIGKITSNIVQWEHLNSYQLNQKLFAGAAIYQAPSC